MINIKSFCFNPFRENSFLLWDESGNCVAVDPSPYGKEEYDLLDSYIKSEGLKPKEIWLTHGHFDHVYGVARLAKEYSMIVRMSPEDRIILDNNHIFADGMDMDRPDCGFETSDLKDGDVLGVLEGSPFKVISTPGHTPGSLCLYDEVDRLLLSGDTLFAGSIGRTDHLGGDYDKEIVSIMDKLMGLPGDVDVLPGHGHRTTVSDERMKNPFLQPFNEPEEDIEGIELHI